MAGGGLAGGRVVWRRRDHELGLARERASLITARRRAFRRFRINVIAINFRLDENMITGRAARHSDGREKHAYYLYTHYSLVPCQFEFNNVYASRGWSEVDDGGVGAGGGSDDRMSSKTLGEQRPRWFRLTLRRNGVL